MFPGDAAQPSPQSRLLAQAHRRQAPLRRAMLPRNAAGTTLGHPEAGLQGHHGPAAPLRGQKFPSASSLSMSISNAWLATSFLSRVFSASSSRSRLAWLAFIPP